MFNERTPILHSHFFFRWVLYFIPCIGRYYFLFLRQMPLAHCGSFWPWFLFFLGGGVGGQEVVKPGASLQYCVFCLFFLLRLLTVKSAVVQGPVCFAPAPAIQASKSWLFSALHVSGNKLTHHEQTTRKLLNELLSSEETNHMAW